MQLSLSLARLRVRASGRMSRKEFILASHALGTAQVLCLALALTAALAFDVMVGALTCAVCMLLLTPSAVSIQVRRLHDTGRSGLWIMPFAALPVLAVLTVWFIVSRIGLLTGFVSGAFAQAPLQALLIVAGTLCWMGTECADLLVPGFHLLGDEGSNVYGEAPPVLNR